MYVKLDQGEDQHYPNTTKGTPDYIEDKATTPKW